MSTLPPGPRTPSLIQTLVWSRRPLPLLRRCQRRFGHTFTLRMLGRGSLVFTSHPQAIQRIFKANHDELSGGLGNRILEPALGDRSLLLLDGQRHRRMRRLLLPPFHGQRMMAYADIIQRAARHNTASWQPGQVQVVRDAMKAISLDVILEAVFGVPPERLDSARQVVKVFADIIGTPMVYFAVLRRDYGRWSPGHRYQRAMRNFQAFLEAQIAARRAEGGQGEDVLSMLLAARDEAGEPLRDDELRHQLRTLVMAGHETTSNGLSWAFRWLLTETAAAERLDEELAGVAPDAPAAALARLPYLSAVCDEALRILPVIPAVTRVTLKPFQLMDHLVPAGCHVTPVVHLAHHREEVFENPDRFRPERFMGRSYGAYEYLPFGGGDRRCVGRAFALYEMKIALGTLWPMLRLQGVHPARTPERHGITMTPAKGLPVRVLERR